MEARNDFSSPLKTVEDIPVLTQIQVLSQIASDLRIAKEHFRESKWLSKALKTLTIDFGSLRN